MAQAPAITASFPEPDIGVLSFDLPGRGANILSRPVLEELSGHLDQLEARQDLSALILQSAKPGTFIAGADLREFVVSFDLPSSDVEQLCRFGQTLFGRLSRTPFVTIAAIDGVCLGGGAELASWCDRRLVSRDAKTQIGFPEVKLGLYPAWGGTVRVPRLIGLANAVELITGGENISAQQACALGWALGPVDRTELLEAAMRLAREEQQTRWYLADRERWSQPLEMNETELAFLGVTASAYIRGQTKDQYPAPVQALEVMLEGAGLDSEAACQLEAQQVTTLWGGSVNRALINVFFLTDRIKKDPGVSSSEIEVRPVKSVCVVGAGIMGSGIVAANLKHELGVLLADASPAALESGARLAIEEAAYSRELKGTDVQRALQIAPHLKLATADTSLSGCDLVVEAVVENQQVKQQVLKRLESQLSDDAILASNTSTIPITRLASVLQRPERFCGLHFFNPVRRMRLVEVIRGEQTNDATVATAVAYAKRLGKYPIVVNDGPGFLVNRLLFPYMNEALELVAQGAEIKAIERAAKSFGMPMGPIELYDMVGMDTAFYAGRTMWEAFPRRTVASPILPALVKAGRLGRKSGRGFFLYDKHKKHGGPQPDPDLGKIVDQYIREHRTFSHDELQRRLFLPMVLEATRALQDKIVRDVRDIDLGMIFGLGFPAFRGGLMWWADEVGAAQLVEWLKPFEQYGERLQPTPLLLDMAQHGRKFYT